MRKLIKNEHMTCNIIKRNFQDIGSLPPARHVTRQALRRIQKVSLSLALIDGAAELSFKNMFWNKTLLLGAGHCTLTLVTKKLDY